MMPTKKNANMSIDGATYAQTIVNQSCSQVTILRSQRRYNERSMYSKLLGLLVLKSRWAYVGDRSELG